MSGRGPARQARSQRQICGSPAIITDRLWRAIALAASLLLLALTASGCDELNAEGQLDSALQGDGYQAVNVVADATSDAPPGGLITIAYTKGPTGKRPARCTARGENRMGHLSL